MRKFSYMFFLLFLFSCVQNKLVKYEYFSNGKVAAFYNLDELKGDSYKIEYYINGKIAKVYRKDGFEEYYDTQGNLVLIYDTLLERYKTVDGKLANDEFKFACREDVKQVCKMLKFENGNLEKEITSSFNK